MNWISLKAARRKSKSYVASREHFEQSCTYTVKWIIKCLLFVLCIAVLHMTMPAVSTVHYNCFMLQHHILSMRCEHTQSHTQTEAGLRTQLFSLTKRGVKNTLFGTNMCFIPQKVTIKIAVENKRLWLGVMCKIVIVACEIFFISQSIWAIYNCSSVYGRLRGYLLMLHRILSMFFRIFSHLLHFNLCFFSSAFTYCLVCESNGLHLITHFVSWLEKIMKDDVFLLV